MAGSNSGTILLIVFLSIIFIGIIVVVALVVFGVFTEKNAKDIIKGVFSLVDIKKEYVTSTDGSAVIMSKDNSIPCKDYSWKYGTFTAGKISIDDALIWQGDTSKILVAASTDGSAVTLSKPTSSTGTNSQWIFNDDFTWCLKSNPKICLFNSSGNLIVRTKGVNINFNFEPVKAVVSPTCK